MRACVCMQPPPPCAALPAHAAAEHGRTYSSAAAAHNAQVRHLLFAWCLTSGLIDSVEAVEKQVAVCVCGGVPPRAGPLTVAFGWAPPLLPLLTCRDIWATWANAFGHVLPAALKQGWPGARARATHSTLVTCSRCRPMRQKATRCFDVPARRRACAGAVALRAGWAQVSLRAVGRLHQRRRRAHACAAVALHQLQLCLQRRCTVHVGARGGDRV